MFVHFNRLAVNFFTGSLENYLKFGMISLKVIHLCIVRLLANPDNEASLECLCRLLVTVGRDLEQPSKGLVPISSVITQGCNFNSKSSKIIFQQINIFSVLQMKMRRQLLPYQVVIGVRGAA